MDRIGRFSLIQRVESILLKGGGILANIALCAMVVLVTSGAVLRYGFGWTPGWNDSICAFLVLFIVLMSAGDTLARDKHIRIKFFYDRFSPRWRAILDLACGLISLSIVGYLIYSTTELSLFSKEINATTPNGIRLFPLQATVPVGFALLFVAILRFTVRSVIKIFQRS